jgi:hypothetical protein
MTRWLSILMLMSLAFADTSAAQSAKPVRLPRGRAFIVPLGPDTRGHGTHTFAALWEQYLAELLKVSENARQ